MAYDAKTIGRIAGERAARQIAPLRKYLRQRALADAAARREEAGLSAGSRQEAGALGQQS